MDEKAEIKYQLVNKLPFYKTLREGKKLDKLSFIAYINSLNYSCSELAINKFVKKEKKEKNKKKMK